MQHPWDIYENLQEIVYVTDMDSYQVVYINRYGREQLGIRSVEEVQGQPCYQVLQKCASPCSICTNHKLKPGQFYE